MARDWLAAKPRGVWRLQWPAVLAGNNLNPHSPDEAAILSALVALLS